MNVEMTVYYEVNIPDNYPESSWEAYLEMFERNDGVWESRNEYDSEHMHESWD